MTALTREGAVMHLERHVPVELGVSGSIHLAHAAFADLGGDGVGAERGAGFKTHQIQEPPTVVGRYL